MGQQPPVSHEVLLAQSAARPSSDGRFGFPPECPIRVKSGRHQGEAFRRVKDTI
jgi:hypothetical protein